MALSSVTNTTGGAAALSDATSTKGADSKQKAALDKEAFLKLLVAQMKNQDPLKPQEGTEFVTQLSQFAMVEQSVTQTAKLDAITAQMTGLASNEATSLVNQDVTIRGTGIAFDGVNATGSSVNLASAVTKMTVQIQDSSGRTVRTLEVGARPAGPAAITWDGKDDNGVPAPKGPYAIKVDAKDANGNPVTATQDVTGKVSKVNFDKGYPELVLDSGVTAPISDLVSVGGKIR